MLSDPNVPPSASTEPDGSGSADADPPRPAAAATPEPRSSDTEASALSPRARSTLRRWFGRGPAAPDAPRTPRAPRGRVSGTAGRVAAGPSAAVTALLAERELALGGIREGVLSVDSRGHLTRLNETARLLLNLPPEAIGRPLDRLGLDAETVRALGTRGPSDRDRACIAAGRMLVLNQVTVQPLRGRTETVTTLRDRTELVTLRLRGGPGVNAPGPVGLPSPSDQTDEFTHRVHTVETLAALGEASVDYLAAICAEQRGPLTRIMDPSITALLISRTTLVGARGATLRLTVDSAVPRLDPATSADAVTVLGILLDNALDSVDGSAVRRITVQIDCTAVGADAPLAARLSDVRLQVHDTGPGIAGGLIEHLFGEEQVAPAPVRQRADPGFGLATVQLIATRRGGNVSYEFIDGAAFDVVLPVRPAPTPTAAAGPVA